MENEKSTSSVEAAGKQRGTITAGYLEDVTRARTVASAGSWVNVSRGKARRGSFVVRAYGLERGTRENMGWSWNHRKKESR